MSKRYIILNPVSEQEKGKGVVTICDTSVSVSLSGTECEYAVIFTSSKKPDDKIDAGTIKGGTTRRYELSKSDADLIDGVTLMYEEKAVISGVYKNEENDNFNSLNDLNFKWTKIEDGRFAESLPIVRHVFENINVIDRICRYKYYYYGTNENLSAVAVPSKLNEQNPFLHLPDCACYINGYWVVGINKEEKYFYKIK